MSRIKLPYRNILVTGGCGFIGSNFLNKMVRKYRTSNWINLDAMYYCANKLNISEDVRESRNYHFIKGNTQSLDLVLHILEEYNVDCIINFAAQSHVCNSFAESLTYTRDNIMGTHTLLECCRLYGIEYIKKFIHVSTDEVYGESIIGDNDKKNENSILFPTNPYSATKAGAEMLAISYYKSFGLPLIITRGNNVYGPRQYPEKLIPKFIMKIHRGEKLTIHGKGNQVRGFMYVDDVVNAFDILLEKGNVGEIYNIGSQEEHDVMETTKLLLSNMDKDEKPLEEWTIYVKDREFNDERYYIDANKLNEMGWKPEVKFKEGIEKTIEWYLDNMKQYRELNE